jgi:hypothetical protein
MTEDIGNMNNKILIVLMSAYSLFAVATDNEIFVDQSGASASIDLEQLGSGNLIGGLNASSGSMTYLDLDGSTMTLDINLQVNVTGDSNTFTLNQATSALASTLDLDWTINGSDNTLSFDINYDLGTSYLDLDGSDNTVNFDGSGYQGGYFYLDHTGGNRTFDITQSSTLDNDWLKIISSGNNGTVCVIQNDSGTSTSC